MASLADPEVLRAEVEAARELLQRGDPGASRAQFVDLLAEVDRVVERPAELAAHRARLLLGLAAADFELTGDLATTLDRLAEATRDAERADSAELMTSIHGQRALILLRRGDHEEALRAFDEAVAHVTQAPAYDQMTVLLNRGALLLERGDLKVAARDFADSLLLAQSDNEPMMQFKAQHNLGYVYFLQGRLPRALATLEAADRVNPGDAHPIAILDRARVLREAGLSSDADELLARAAELFAASGLEQDLGETELSRAQCARTQGNLSTAARLADAALGRFAKRGNLAWQRKAALVVLQVQRDVCLLESHDDSGEQRSSAEDRPNAEALAAVSVRALELATLCLAEDRRDLGEAAELLAFECGLRAGHRASGPVTESAGALATGDPRRLRRADGAQVRLHRREVRALAAWADQDPARAAREVRAGLRELGGLQQRFGSLDLRTASAVHGSALARLGLEIACSRRSAGAVLEMVEQARAVSTRLPPVRPPADAATASLLAELRRAEEEIRFGEGTSNTEALGRTRARVVSLQRLIRAQSWELEGSQGMAGRARGDGGVGLSGGRDGAFSLTLRRVRSQADLFDVAFVTFARRRGRWMAVVVAGPRAEVVDLAAVAEIESLIGRLRADLDVLARPGLPRGIRSVVRGSAVHALAHLDKLIVEPLGVAGRSLVVSVSGALTVLPWSMLPSRAGLPVVVTPSAWAWLSRVESPPRSAAPRVVAVAGPGLRTASREAEKVAASWPEGQVLLGEDATTAAVRAALSHADVLHVAAHGRHRQDNPLFSSVRLADGQLYAYEIDPAGGMPQVVVLSACEAGLATVRPGEETLGLAHVLLHLGVRTVVAGVAGVNDEAMSAVMRRLHERLATGNDLACVLAQALHETVDRAYPAPLVCFGSTW